MCRSKRIDFEAWNLDGLEAPRWAMSGHPLGSAHAVAAAIASKNGWVLYDVHPQGHSFTGGTVEARHYTATLGRRGDGGWRRSVDFLIPCGGRW